MTLAAGARLGPYEILSPLGAGGMGEVYRARDTRLSRDVAIKVLPDSVAQDADRLARFRREAQLLASLNHPNIAHIHGLEESGGAEALIMELVEGETLAERIAQGPIPVDDALGIARQIADALESAHERGIVHRDLKPSNVKITPEGKVKVLDFGLAKALSRDGSSPDVTSSPTLTAAATQEGVVIGTAAYMSPEQARGKSVDKRADIWAFGTVLYEMLAGRRVFEGETISDTLAAVLRADIDWGALPPETPPRVRRVLALCLERDPKKRLRDIADASIEMDRLEDYVAAPAAQATPPARGTRLPWVVAAFFGVVAAFALWRTARAPAPATASRLRLTLVLSPGEPLTEELGSAVVISPDGRRLAYTVGGPRSALHVRQLERLDDTALAETSGATSPFFSPDGEWVAFFAGGKLKKIPVSGGAPLTICDAQSPRGGTWTPDGTIVFSPMASAPLLRVSTEGGQPRPLTKLDDKANERSHRWPHVLPGGRAAVFMTQYRGQDYDEGALEAVDLATGARKLLHRGGAFPRFAASGHLLFLRRGTLYAAPLDLRRLTLTGQPAAVLERVLGSTANEASSDGSGDFDVSPGGLLIYRTGSATSRLSRLVLMDRKGGVLGSLPDARLFLTPRFAPDGKRIAVAVDDSPGIAAWVWDLEAGVLRRLTFLEGGVSPIWSPDGTKIVYTSNQLAAQKGSSGATAPRMLGWKNADGSGEEHRLWSVEGSGNVFMGSFSPDARRITYQEGRRETQYDLRELDLEGPLAPGVRVSAKTLLESRANEVNAVFSPDGRWLAYSSDESGRFEVYLTRAADARGKWQVSDGGGDWPRWSRDGQVYYVSGEAIFSAPVSGEAEAPAVGHPQRLFGEKFRMSIIGPEYDVAADGQRFVVLSPLEERGVDPHNVNLVFGWFDELERLAPTGNRR